MEYILWDKKSPINGVSAKEILSTQPQFINDKEIVLEVIENTRQVTRIESVNILRGICNAPDEVSALEIIPYFDECMKQQNATEAPVIEIEEIKDDNAIIAETLALALEEIETLKAEISAIKGE